MKEIDKWFHQANGIEFIFGVVLIALFVRLIIDILFDKK